MVGGLEWLEAAMSLTEISPGYYKVSCLKLKFVHSALAKAIEIPGKSNDMVPF